MKIIEAYFDGAIRGGNPGGLPSYGFFITHDGKTICEGCGVLEEVPKTNNVAEWYALYFVLQNLYHILCTHPVKKYFYDIKIYGDSQLVINQMIGKYSVKSSHLYDIFLECKNMLLSLENNFSIDICFVWVTREENMKADKLAEKAYKNYIYPF